MRPVTKGYLGAVDVPGVEDVGADVASRLAVPLDLRAHVDDHVLERHGEERLDLELEKHGAVVRVAVVLHVALVEAGVFALQVRQQDDAVEVGDLSLVLEGVASTVDDSIPAVDSGKDLLMQ